MQDNAKRKDSPTILLISAITFALALTVAAVLLLIPFAINLLVSFKDYKVINEIFSSPWVGLKHYQRIFNDAIFIQSLYATVRHTLLSAAFVFAFSLAACYVLHAAGSVHWLRHALCTLLLMPIAIPGEIWARAYYSIYPPDAVNNAMLLAAWCSVKYLGLAALLMSAGLSRGNRSRLTPLLSACIAALIVLALFGRFDFWFLRRLPHIRREVAGVDFYAFQTSILMGFGAGTAANTVIAVIRFLLLSAAVRPVVLLLRKLFHTTGGGNEAGIKHRLMSLAFVTGILGLAVALYLSSVPSVVDISKSLVNVPVTAFLALAWALCNTMLCYLLAQPVVCMGKKGRVASGAALIVLTALGAAAMPIGEYLIFRNIGIINTLSAVVLSGIASVWGTWALVIAAKGMSVSTNTEWYKRMWRPALALFAVQAALRFTDTLPISLYSFKPPYVNLFIALIPGMGGSRVELPDLLVILLAVPVALLLAARTALDEKDNLGMMLP